MSERKDLEASCPKCGKKINGPMPSPTTQVSRIDKNDIIISINGLMHTAEGWKIVRSPLPAWGYTCDKCGTLFAVGQYKMDQNEISNEKMKEKLRGE